MSLKSRIVLLIVSPHRAKKRDRDWRVASRYRKAGTSVRKVILNLKATEHLIFSGYWLVKQEISLRAFVPVEQQLNRRGRKTEPQLYQRKGPHQ